MFEFITGDLVRLGDDYAVLEAGGLGYRLKLPKSSVEAIRGKPDPVRLHTVCRLKDEVFQIYGFASDEERSIFDRICSVSGVGPGIALSILSGIPIAEFRTAVLTDQAKVLEKIKGVGKKTAQRLVLELKDVIGGDGGPVNLPHVGSSPTQISSDAVAALTAIGFSSTEAEASVQKAYRLHPDADLEELIKHATRY